MFTYSFDTSGMRPLMVGTKRALQAGMALAVRKGLNEGAQYARTHHIHKRRTGRLTSTAELRGEMKEAGDTGAYGFLTNTTPYASYIEYGTAAHDIWPKEGHGFIGPTRRGQSRRARTDIGTRRVALRFEVGGKVIFRRMVHHPGNPPMPFMQPASEYAGFVIVRVIETEIIPRVAEIWT